MFRLPADKAIDDVLDGDDGNVEEEETEDECAQINNGERTRGDDNASSAAKRRSQFSFHQAPLEGSTMTWVEWLWSVLTASDDQIRSQCGDDALQYLTFQRHIIAISSIGNHFMQQILVTIYTTVVYGVTWERQETVHILQ